MKNRALKKGKGKAITSPSTPKARPRARRAPSPNSLISSSPVSTASKRSKDEEEAPITPGRSKRAIRAVPYLSYIRSSLTSKKGDSNCYDNATGLGTHYFSYASGYTYKAILKNYLKLALKFIITFRANHNSSKD